MVTTLLRDLRYGLRMLARPPDFALVAIANVVLRRPMRTPISAVRCAPV
jgi:hypothetical protein